ncbi:alpha/beta fold hydrolase [Catenulispora pinisilvae]|uniref:alpha/beta fold hydrolase n=1 Tax=Catenulispora pinisilvae TaxID=2705253 RepID=UPI001891F745|nr:alpha/beta fold hydrolase [Catenulispora pinisilvae]
MATYILIHGASSDSWLWHRVVPLLRAAGHDVVTPDLPASDPEAGIPQYTDAVVAALGDRANADDLIVVAQSMGSFTGATLTHRVPVKLLVFLSAMAPKEGETPGQWWEATGYSQARQESDARLGLPADADLKVVFFHDVPEKIVDEAWERGEVGQSDRPFGPPPMPALPSGVPIRYLVGRDDRFFPLDFQRRTVQERLGFAPDEMEGGHLLPLAHPEALVQRLEAYRVGAEL